MMTYFRDVVFPVLKRLVSTPNYTEIFRQLLNDIEAGIVLVNEVSPRMYDCIVEEAPSNEAGLMLLAVLIYKENDPQAKLATLPLNLQDRVFKKIKMIKLNDQFNRPHHLFFSEKTKLVKIKTDSQKQLAFLFQCLLERNELFLPLLKIIKFGMLDAHDLSKKYSKKLKLRCDLDSDGTDHIVSQVNTKNASGAYFPSDQEVHFGADRGLSDLLGTIMHEFTHFISHEVFDNGCDPYYAQNDEHHKKQYKQIIQALYDIKDGIHPLLRDAFDEYEQIEYPSELIARTVQLIALGEEQLLWQDYGDLMHYFMEVFLPACKAHLEKLEKCNNILPNSGTGKPIVRVYGDLYNIAVLDDEVEYVFIRF